MFRRRATFATTTAADPSNSADAGADTDADSATSADADADAGAVGPGADGPDAVGPVEHGWIAVTKSGKVVVATHISGGVAASLVTAALFGPRSSSRGSGGVILASADVTLTRMRTARVAVVLQDHMPVVHVFDVGGRVANRKAGEDAAAQRAAAAAAGGGGGGGGAAVPFSQRPNDVYAPVQLTVAPTASIGAAKLQEGLAGGDGSTPITTLVAFQKNGAGGALLTATSNATEAVLQSFTCAQSDNRPLASVFKLPDHDAESNAAANNTVRSVEWVRNGVGANVPSPVTTLQHGTANISTAPIADHAVVISADNVIRVFATTATATASNGSNPREVEEEAEKEGAAFVERAVLLVATNRDREESGGGGVVGGGRGGAGGASGKSSSKRRDPWA